MKPIGELQEENCNNLFVRLYGEYNEQQEMQHTEECILLGDTQDTKKQEALRSSREDSLHTSFLSL